MDIFGIHKNYKIVSALQHLAIYVQVTKYSSPVAGNVYTHTYI